MVFNPATKGGSVPKGIDVRAATTQPVIRQMNAGIPKPLTVVATLLCALSGMEGFARWWMHPHPAGIGDPVLCYRPDDSSSMHPAATRGLFGNAVSTRTDLPDLVSRSLPSLHCSSGTAARVDRADGKIIHLAFFEWNQSDSTSVLEAFKHLPDDCLGSIGMKLIGHQRPRSYRIGGETLTFDHTVFRDRDGVIVQAFKGVWISGAQSLIGDGMRGGFEQWRQIRWQAACKRFRPAYARVAQGAVRGAATPDEAWEAFKETMLNDLRFESPRVTRR